MRNREEGLTNQELSKLYRLMTTSEKTLDQVIEEAHRLGYFTEATQLTDEEHTALSFLLQECTEKRRFQRRFKTSRERAQRSQPAAPLIHYAPININSNNHYHEDHGHPEQQQRKNEAEELKILIQFFVAVAAYCFAGVTQQLSDDIERLQYDNEGYRAYLDLTSMVLTGGVVSGFGTSYVATVLFSAQVANPMFWTVLAALAFGVIGMAIGASLATAIGDYFEHHPDPLTADDAYRFDLTPVEMGQLSEQECGYNETLVKCAIIAIHDRIQTIKQNTPWTEWSLYRNPEILSLLRTLREIRQTSRMDLNQVRIDDFLFPLKLAHGLEVPVSRANAAVPIAIPVFALDETAPQLSAMCGKY